MTPQLKTDLLPDFFKARELYLLAKAINDLNLKIDEDSKKAVLKMYPFMDTDTGKRILNPNLDYMMSDQVFKDKYIPLLHEEHKARGLKNAQLNRTADHESRPLMDAALNNFLEIGFKMLPSEMAAQLKDGLMYLDIREKIINLMCSLEADKTRSAKEILNDVVGGA